MKKQRDRLRRMAAVALGWAGATVFFSAMVAVSELGNHKPLDFVLYLNAVICGLWTLSLPLLSRCAQRFPFSHKNRFRHGAVLLLIVIGVATLFWFLLLAIIYLTWFPYRASNPTLNSVLSSKFGSDFFRVNVLICLGLVMALQYRHTRRDFQAERMRAAELERQLAESRLAALRMQLHPHFLFNTLHTIAGLIGDQPATARRMVVALGDFLRLTLKGGTGSVRSLAEELEFVDLYMSIEKFRLGDRLLLDYEIEPMAATAEVPHLLLQPLFENAVRHGAARLTGDCGIAFQAHRENGRLNLCLENDGLISAPSPEAVNHGLGLTNTLARLHLHYGADFTFEYKDRPQGGVRIELSLPWRKSER
ncbi:MAG TPA: histidine kinase [Blastocatellia bacterium]|nr:histidine kinase [Blastocatellia bacterium]